MEPAHELRLRPGWYPDPHGEFLYRKFDGTSWTEDTAQVPASRRASFQQQRSAMARRSPSYGAGIGASRSRSSSHLRSVPRGTVGAELADPGRALGIAAFVCALLLSTILSMILARMSRKRSNAAGLPRNGYATAALVMAALRFTVIVVALVLVILVPLLAGSGGSSSSN